MDLLRLFIARVSGGLLASCDKFINSNQSIVISVKLLQQESPCLSAARLRCQLHLSHAQSGCHRETFMLYSDFGTFRRIASRFHARASVSFGGE
jgi:hypothetical protein